MDFKSLIYKPKRLEKYNKKRISRAKFLSYFLAFACVLNIADYIIKNPNKSSSNSLSYSNFNHDILRCKNSEESYDLFEDENADFITLELPEEFDNIDDVDDVVERAIIVSQGIREMVKDIPNSVKLEYIYNHYKMSPYEFNVIKSVTCREGKLGNYDDAFATITSFYNRMRSYKKRGYARVWLNTNGLISLYDQVTAPGQYEVYEKETYLIAWNDFESDSFQAVVDFLYVADRDGVPFMHSYMDFVSANGKSDDRVQFVNDGNNYFHELVLDDIIPFEERYYYDEESLDIDESPRLILK